MTKLILIPTAQTDWRAQGRLTGDTDLPLNEFGHRQAVAFGEAIADLQPTMIRCGPEKATKQTATLIAHELSLKLRTVAGLREMDLGHWEGLTEEQFRERFGRVFRQWRSEPTSVEPPQGEAVADVAGRLCTCVGKIVKRHEDKTIVLALGQFACAIMRCRLDDGHYQRFWEYVDGDAQWHVIELRPGPRGDSRSSNDAQAANPPASSEGAPSADRVTPP